MAYRVIIIENNPDALSEMIAKLRRSPDFEVTATYNSAHAAINPSGMFHPDLFLLNVENDEVLDMVPDFVEKFPGAYILGTLNQWDPFIVQDAMEGGATGCILKPFTAKDVIEHLRLYSMRGQRKPAKLISFFSPKANASRSLMPICNSVTCRFSSTWYRNAPLSTPRRILSSLTP